MKKNFTLMIVLTWLLLTGIPLAGQTVAGSKPAVADAYETGQPAKEQGEQPANGQLQLRAGAPALCDSMVWYAPNGERLFKIAYEYDAAGNQILSVRYRPVNGALAPSDKEEYAYDVAGNRTLFIACNWENGAWVPYHKNEDTYDAAGYLALSETFEWQDDAWVPRERSENAFDVAGKQTLYAHYYPEANGAWQENENLRLSTTTPGSIPLRHTTGGITVSG